MKIHFVYAGDPHNNLPQAPFTITRHVHDALSGLAEVVYYDWCHCGPFEPVSPDDIVIGHPNYPSNTATRQLFQNNCRAKLLIFPFHHGMPEINLPFDDLVCQAGAVLSITGPYWYDTIGDTPFAHWRRKMTRVDMAVDVTNFPHVKTTFNPPGQRGFYFMGADRPEKGLGVLERIFAGTSHQLHIYGMVGGDHSIARLPNVHLHGWAETVPQFAHDLATVADCCVHGAVSDANPTTLLEAAAWGFAVACTPQSGYWPDRPFYGLDAADIDGCRQLLGYIQTMPEAILRMRAAQNRRIVEDDFNWARFTNTVLGVVKRYL